VISQHERYLAGVEEGAFLAKGSEAEKRGKERKEVKIVRHNLE